MGTGSGAPTAGPHVPLVVPHPDDHDVDLPLTRDGRRARAPQPAGAVSPVRALAGAGLAVAGVALGIGALLSVVDAPGGSPAVMQVAAGDEAPAADPGAVLPPDDAPAVEPPAAAVTVPVTPTRAAPAPSVASPAAPAPAVPAAPPAAAPARVEQPAPRPPVTVLNNSTRSGLAARAAARFARAGWPVRQTGNFTGRLRATTVYYEPGQRAAAQRFAATFRGVPRVLPRAANIPGPRGLVVVVTRDFPA